jgi:sporulation protein YlmC with PRC-barrel domain
MIRTTLLGGTAIEARDGRIGSVEDVYFDDRAWKVRYLVVDTGRWLRGRQVLIAPEAILQDWHGNSGIPVNLTKEQVKASPEIDTVEPVSRRAEELLHSYYGWNPYWGIPGEMPMLVPEAAAGPEERREAVEAAAASGDPHLRSIAELIGYQVHATDGEVGHIEDVLIDDEHNRIAFLVVATAAGRQVLIPPEWICGIDWAASTVAANVVRHDMETRPEYRPAA